jgi:hypothetical protein
MFDATGAERMKSEDQTMIYIRKTTSFPVPEVYGWSTTKTDIGVPYAFISFVEGRPLHELWLDDNTSKKFDLRYYLRSQAAWQNSIERISHQLVRLISRMESFRRSLGPLASEQLILERTVGVAISRMDLSNR